MQLPDLRTQGSRGRLQQGRDVLEFQQRQARPRQLAGTAVQLADTVAGGGQFPRPQIALEVIEPTQEGVAIGIQLKQLAYIVAVGVHLPAQQGVAGLLGDFRRGRRAQQMVAAAVALLGGDGLLPQLQRLGSPQLHLRG